MEHMSNSLNNRKAGMNASPAIMAQMRPSYNHHSSVPETALMDQLKSMKGNNGGMTPNLAVNAPANLKSS